MPDRETVGGKGARESSPFTEKRIVGEKKKRGCAERNYGLWKGRVSTAKSKQAG